MRHLPLLLFAAIAYAQTKANSDWVFVGSVNYCSDAGSTDSYACTLARPISAYQTGQVFLFRANTTNTGGATVNFNAAGAIAIKKSGTSGLVDPADGEICAGCFVMVTYTGTVFQMIGAPGTSSGGGGSGTANYAISFTSQTSVTASHAMGTKNIVVACYDASDIRIEPHRITSTSTSAATITFLSAQSGYCVVNGTGGTGGGGGGTVSAPYVLLHATGAASNSPISGGAANYGICHRFGLQAQHAFTGLALEVTVASGTCGGTCGFGVAVYNSAKDSKLGQTAIMTSGGSPNFNTTGAKLLTWASGANVSAGTLTLAAGTYYACYSTDSTAANFPMINVDLGTAENGTNPGPHHGYQAAFTTGSGSGLTFPSTLTGTFNATSSGGQVIPMVFVP